MEYIRKLLAYDSDRASHPEASVSLFAATEVAAAVPLFRDRPHFTPTTVPSQSSPPAHASAARSAAERDEKLTKADL